MSDADEFDEFLARVWAPQPSWVQHAACRGMKPSLFYPERGEDSRYAKAVCASCPVATECMEQALENREKFGVWGGLSQMDRRAIRRAETRAA